MQALANLIISVMELAEAEGRAAHRGIIRLLTRALLIIIASILAVAGIIWIGWGIYLILHRLTGPIGAAFVYGGFLCVTAVILWSYGKKSPKTSVSDRSAPGSIPDPSAPDQTITTNTNSNSPSSQHQEQGTPYENSHATASR